MCDLYKDVFTSEKIPKYSKILVMSPDKNYNYITLNLHYILMLNLEIDFVDNKFKFEENENVYDVIIFNNIFSYYDNNYIGDMLMKYKKILKNTGHIVFINELIEYSRQYYHPITFFKNLLYNVSKYNFGKIVTITDMYRHIHECGIQVFDCYRIFSVDIITYPIQMFMITTKFRNI
jgi:hypothetical protein